MTSTEHLPAIADTVSSELAIRSGQMAFNDTQVAALRQIGIEDATDADLQVFFHHCRRTGLDPFARQIYMIGREADVKVREDLGDGRTRVVTQRMTKHTIQTGIDGYRLIGNRAARAEGVGRVGHKPVLYAGNDGVWSSIWPDDQTPIACQYTLVVEGTEITSICYYAEYVQTVVKDGQAKPNSMWRKMPRNQLAKCTEAQSWRKAFPADFSDILLEDAVQPAQVIDSDGAPVRVPSNRRGVDGLRDAINDEPPSEAEPEAAPEDSSSMAASTRRKWLNRMFALLGEGDCPDRDDQLIVIAACAGLPVGQLEHRDQLTDDQLRNVVNTLNAWQKASELGDKITEILNTATLNDANEKEA